MDQIKTYVCPVCGNVIHSTKKAEVSCCGTALQPLETVPVNERHQLIVERSEDEYYIWIKHPMSKEHYISFIMAVKNDGYEIKKLYPEGAAEARFKINGVQYFLYYCNLHGLFRVSVPE